MFCGWLKPYISQNKTVSEAQIFHLENRDRQEVGSNGKFLTLNLQLLKNRGHGRKTMAFLNERTLRMGTFNFIQKRSIRKFKPLFFCVGRNFLLLQPTWLVIRDSICSNFSIGVFSNCRRKNFMTVNDYTKNAEGLHSFFRSPERIKSFENCLSSTNYTRRASEIRANNGSAAASRNLKAASSLVTVKMEFHHTRKGLYLAKIVTSRILLYVNGKKSLQNYISLHLWDRFGGSFCDPIEKR